MTFEWLNKILFVTPVGMPEEGAVLYTASRIPKPPATDLAVVEVVFLLECRVVWQVEGELLQCQCFLLIESSHLPICRLINPLACVFFIQNINIILAERLRYHIVLRQPNFLLLVIQCIRRNQTVREIDYQRDCKDLSHHSANPKLHHLHRSPISLPGFWRGRNRRDVSHCCADRHVRWHAWSRHWLHTAHTF